MVLKKKKPLPIIGGGFQTATGQQVNIPLQNQPQPQAPQPIKEEKKVEDRVFRDTKTNEISGITLPDGRTFLGLKPQDVETIAAGELSKKGGLATQEFEKQGQAQRQAIEAEERARQIGQLTQEQQQLAMSAQTPQELSLIQAAKAGAGNVIPQAVGGAAAGAAGGALAGGALAVPLAVIGGVAGLISGFVSGAKSDLKRQRSAQYSISTGSLTDHTKNMRAFVVSRDVEAYNEQLAYIIRDYSQLKLNADVNINAFLGENGITQLTEYENFLNAGGLNALNNRMAQALLDPNADMSYLLLQQS